MKNDFTNSFILNSLGLPIIKDLHEFSNRIGLSTTLIYILSKKENTHFYTKFYIDKKDGTSRQILSPSFSLKIVQRWILENILYKVGISDVSYAFRKDIGCGIKKNAEMHHHNLYILEMDLKNFFTSIKSDRVYYFFRGIGYNSYISNILTRICTYDGYLPQGAVTSPYLSNLICYKLDIRIKSYCGKRDIVFTRYADDLTFSCDNKDNLSKIYNTIEKIIKDEGYTINEKKTRFLTPKSKKTVTGITINDGKIKAPKEMKRKVRAMIHKAIITKDYAHNHIIKGYISYINSIEEGYKEKIIKYINNFENKNIIHDINIVDYFNENKFYNEINDLQYNSEWPDDFDEEYYQYYYEDKEL